MRELLGIIKMPYQKLKEKIAGISDYSGFSYWYKKGNCNITLCAHIDTVHDNKRKTPDLYYDLRRKTLWASNGLGADDRAGVYALLHIFGKSPIKPNLLFLDDEEIGGLGATEACELIELENTGFFIELDRRNANDCVFYNHEPNDFVAYIEKHGFKKAVGTFSDISILGEYFERCSVNLSCGYYNEHTTAEYLQINQLISTINKVLLIINTAPHTKVWEHKNTFSGGLYEDTGWWDGTYNWSRYWDNTSNEWRWLETTPKTNKKIGISGKNDSKREPDISNIKQKRKKGSGDIRRKSFVKPQDREVW